MTGPFKNDRPLSKTIYEIAFRGSAPCSFLDGGEATSIKLKQVVSIIVGAGGGSALKSGSWRGRFADTGGQGNELHQIQSNVLVPTGAERKIGEFIHSVRGLPFKKDFTAATLVGFRTVMIADEAGMAGSEGASFAC
jgi:hypothetical protein